MQTDTIPPKPETIEDQAAQAVDHATPLFGIVWERRNPYIGAEYHECKLGKWIVATVGWSCTRSEDGPHNVRLHLPGLKPLLKGQFPTIEAAQARAEAAVTHWLQAAEVCPNIQAVPTSGAKTGETQTS
jgi:hypothetical protein